MKMGKEKDTEPTRIDTGILALVRKHKEVTGFPVGRFIEDAIVKHVDELPDEVKSKMGILLRKKKGGKP